MTTTNLAADSEVLAPGQDGYAEAAATVFAAGTPELIVRPYDAAGVAAALRYAVDAGAPVSVRSGGHSVAGFGTHDSGMVIDLRHLSAVRILDHGSRRVRLGAGASWGAVAGTLQRAGLALTAGDTVLWTPPARTGTRPAFTLIASDGVAKSKPVLISVVVA